MKQLTFATKNIHNNYPTHTMTIYEKKTLAHRSDTHDDFNVECLHTNRRF